MLKDTNGQDRLLTRTQGLTAIICSIVGMLVLFVGYASSTYKDFILLQAHVQQQDLTITELKVGVRQAQDASSDTKNEVIKQTAYIQILNARTAGIPEITDWLKNGENGIKKGKP